MLNRRDFLKTTATIAAAAGMLSGEKQGVASEQSASRVRIPYQNIDWTNALQIHTTTHGHITNQNVLTQYLDRGFEFLTLSNYYPSAPYWPLDKMTQEFYRVHHDHPVVVDGKLTDGPFDWNAIITPWVDELDEASRKWFPFKEGGPLFTSYPENILQAPNAEHHSFTDSPTHLCSPGSRYASGTFDAHNQYKTMSHGYHFGSGLPWREAVDKMLDELIFPDGGGVTINHPNWSRLTNEHIFELLDYDPRVLGIEVFNFGSGENESDPESDFSENYWDDVLRTGRQCFGFFVPDWKITEGVNILVVPERTVQACLTAYRQGNWYGAVKGRGILNFKRIHFDGTTLKAETDKPAHFEVIASSGVVFEKTEKQFSFTTTAEERAKYGYLRIKAHATDQSGEILFSQPFVLT